MKSFSLYIHVPFCSRKCLFCSFVIAVGQEHRREEYVHALIVEMKKYQGATITAIYFGGGTPSMLDEKHFSRLMDAVRTNFSWENNLEITLEANPESITNEKVKCWRQHGVSRVSFGVQSLNARFLKFLGRAHSALQAHEAYRILRNEGFHNINLDLMYAFPGQTTQELEEDVRAICSMGSEHLSLYTLTIEPNSRFHATQMKLDHEEKLAEHYLFIGRLLKEYGFKQYEISNFSKPGFESKHNMNYWQGLPYIGLGVGAHGFDGRQRHWNTSNLQEYLQQPASGPAGFEDLHDEQLLMEKILFGLRMNNGILMDLIPVPKMPQVNRWIEDGFLEKEGLKVRATDKGRLVLDELSSRLI